jgi:hypothetical protein
MGTCQKEGYIQGYGYVVLACLRWYYSMQLDDDSNDDNDENIWFISSHLVFIDWEMEHCVVYSHEKTNGR